jgi:hypothetical protein
MLSKPLAQLMGSDLSEFFAVESYRRKLYDFKVAQGPTIAVARASKFFSSTSRDTLGFACANFQSLRSSLCEIVGDRNACNAFTILAPHTHWSEDRPIIYKFEECAQRYVVGNLKIEPKANYVPVSFVFVAGSPLPYEWLEVSHDFRSDDWLSEMQKVPEFAEVLCAKNIPLGIGLDFRFKRLLTDAHVATVENPSDDGHDRYSFIVQFDDFVRNGGKVQDIEQVSWSVHDDAFLGFSENDSVLLTDFRTALGKQATRSDRHALIMQIDQMTNQKAICG